MPATSLFVPGDHPGAVVATELATGPWSAASLHGGPVAALIAHELEQVPADGPMFPARLTVELLRSVTHEPLVVETAVVRPGRKVRVLEARVYRSPDEPRTGETLVARASLQQIRRAAIPVPADLHDVNGPDDPPPPPDDVARVDPTFVVGEPVAFHNAATEHRAIGSFLLDPGPVFDWIRVTADLLPGVPCSPFARAAATADFGNGVSNILPKGGWLFINPDLQLLLTRLPVDEWIGLRAVTRINGDDGVGLAECEVWDRLGRIGRSAQTLLIDRIG